MMTNPSLDVSFLMIVTDPDIELADRCLRSYTKVKDASFKVVVYSNWVSPKKKDKYFHDWQSKYSFVEFIRNDWQDSKPRPSDPRLEGPFDKCTKIWDENLVTLNAEFCATADADFEVLDGRLVSTMVKRLRSSPNLGVLSTDYSPGGFGFDTYSNEPVFANERCHTWFCIYRRALLRSLPVSHSYHESKILSGEKFIRSTWDSSGLLQKAIKDKGFEIAGMERIFQNWFIHYGAFSKNRQLTGMRLAVYRFLRVVAKRGRPAGFPTPYAAYSPLDPLSSVSMVVARLALRLCFCQIDRSNYWPGWGKTS